MSYGKSFLAAILAEGSVSALIQCGKIEMLFKASEVDTYVFVREFVRDYGVLPAADVIETHTGQLLATPSAPALYYLKQMTLRHIDLTLRHAMKEMQAQLTSDAPDPLAALEIHRAAGLALTTAQNAKQVADFRDAYDAIIAEYSSKWKGDDTVGLRLGWPYLDALSGGLNKGDMISYVGRPAMGKTFQMLYGALFGWSKAGILADVEHDQSRLFISMEMAILPIQQRLAAMQTHLPLTQLKQGMLETANYTKLKKGLVAIHGFGAPFYIVDGNLTATVADIEALARQLKPAAIFIDGGYLVQHPTERDRYKRVGENCHLVKALLTPLAPTVISWQFAKTASKKNKAKGEQVTMDDIGYSDAIAQVSSIVLGIFEDESVDTVKRRRIDVLKGRSGETGSFVANWNFDTMDFSEVEGENVEDMQIA